MQPGEKEIGKMEKELKVKQVCLPYLEFQVQKRKSKIIFVKKNNDRISQV
jgi:hypothetical protein